MTIKIGDKTYSTSKPSDLDVQLAASTGCSVEELTAQAGGYPLAGTLAAMLRPYLPKDAPSVPELASDITAAGVDDVRAQVVALYGVKDAAPAKPVANG